MSTLLHLDASASQATSVSRAMSVEFVRGWHKAHRESNVIRRDLSTSDIPPITEQWIQAAFTPKDVRSQEQQSLLSLSGHSSPSCRTAT